MDFREQMKDMLLKPTQCQMPTYITYKYLPIEEFFWGEVFEFLTTSCTRSSTTILTYIGGERLKKDHQRCSAFAVKFDRVSTHGRREQRLP